MNLAKITVLILEISLIVLCICSVTLLLVLTGAALISVIHAVLK